MEKKAKKTKPAVLIRRCYDCANAYLMRSSPHNPIVARCNITGQRNVASHGSQCEHFLPFNGEPDINPMIKCR